jgi:vancomycin resistance protein VanJ
MRLLAAASDLYTFPTLSFLALRLLTGERLGLVALLNNFTPWILLPALPVSAFLLAARRWRRATLVGPAVVALVWLYGALFLPNPPPPACAASDGCITLTIMTYNTGCGLVEPDNLVAALLASNADIIALEETTPEEVPLLDAALSEAYPYRVLYGYGIPGIGLLSRYPIVEHELFDLSARIFPYLRARLDVEGRPLTLIAAHPPPPGFDRRRISYATPGRPDFPLLADVAVSNSPTLLIGDFNTSDQSESYRQLTEAGLRDAFREAGWGFGLTFPASGANISLPPLVRIDYIWYTPDFRAMRAWTGPDAGSDHLPVMAQLIWPS